ncbi:MAG: hypothetical protein UV73_C0003G0186 [Candidatus Gottesmanbacteria bacterium GW2011_GWA2_43_14]|uniref:RNA 2',3'-cyclic phosphodiesterase n=1 Tax=Candidatus Gottesmanbacteria bacterium GW2011_GWA2_43_14 TaxID=1618443 RepID=A0A0G1DKR6_9BACT|nr:MAG: hypothetical protein UV73_C0003G0186 [Candidatus Gottesmanbacteria bacterium GW2011_GWA2_43_14]
MYHTRCDIARHIRDMPIMPIMKKRLFLAFTLPETLTEQFSLYQQKLAKFEELKKLGLRLTAKENLHITLLFLGDCEEDKIGQISGTVKKACQEIAPFPLEFSRMEMHRYIWAVYKNSASFEKLKNILEVELLGTISKKSIIHTTLGRIKREGGKIGLPPAGTVDREFTCGKILLFESHLRNNGPVYSIIEAFNLNGK